MRGCAGNRRVSLVLVQRYPYEGTKSGYEYTSYIVTLPDGEKIECRRYTEDLTDKEKEYMLDSDNDFAERYNVTIELLAEPTLAYNCYAYALYYRGETEFLGITEDRRCYLASSAFDPENPVSYEVLRDYTGAPISSFLNLYWKDSHFVQAPRSSDEVQVGDIVLYYSDINMGHVSHAGVVSSVNSSGNVENVISKWGASGLYEHGVNDVPKAYRQLGGNNGDGDVYYEIYQFYWNHNFKTFTDVNASNHKSVCECSDCATEYLEAHGYGDWYDNGTSNHARECTKCGRESTASHTFGDWTDYDSDSKHKGFCEDCGREVLRTHSFSSWVNSSSGYHKRTCSDCSHVQQEAHVFSSWTSTSDQQHVGTCETCGRTKTESHQFSDWVSSGVYGHTKTCSKCDKAITQAHVFSGTECTICGYTGPGVMPLLPLSTRFDEIMKNSMR